jgi:hypothetical protein
MVSLFQENQPAASSAIQSAVIRDNFEALYDKVKALEVRAQNPATTSISVAGGVVYFRASTSQQLQLINFNTQVLDITQTVGYKTIKNLDGSLTRTLQAFAGPSAFQSQGLFLEILVSLRSNGLLTFTESYTSQNNTLSSPFNIYKDDAEIPIALVILEKTAAGVLQPIVQDRIKDVRPFLSPALQNNQQVTTIENTVNDNVARITKLEPSLRTTNACRVRLLPIDKRVADGTTTTNTQVEVLSGHVYSPTNQRVKFWGATVDFSVSASTTFPTGTRVKAAATPALLANQWNKALICLQYTNLLPNNETGELVVIHGTQSSSPSLVVPPTAGATQIPLAMVIYRFNSGGTNIVPFVSEQFCGTERLSYEFTIFNFVEVPNTTNNPNYAAFITFDVDLSGTGFTVSDVTTNIFQVGAAIELFDDSTQPLRRFITSSSYNLTTQVANITVSNSFVEISSLRNPKVRSTSKHIPFIDDLRPFIGIS